MEIDIPDLQDLEFEKTCDCRYRSHLWLKTGQLIRPKSLKYGDPFPQCELCKGNGSYLTPVGERLVQLLKKKGLLRD